MQRGRPEVERAERRDAIARAVRADDARILLERAAAVERLASDRDPEKVVGPTVRASAGWAARELAVAAFEILSAARPTRGGRVAMRWTVGSFEVRLRPSGRGRR